MSKLKVLLVENSGFQGGSIQKGSLDAGTFDRLLEGDAELAFRQVEEKDFDVALLDLNLGESGAITYDGIHLARRMRQAKRSLVIVIYSSSITEENELTFPHRQDCLDAGANDVMSLGKLLAMTPEKLDAKLRELVASQTPKADPTVLQFAPDLVTRAAIEVFGLEPLRALILIAGTGLAEMQVTALQSGYSGAAIFRLSAVTGTTRTKVLRIIKVSRTKYGLADELQRRPVPGTHFSRSAVVPELQLFSSSGLHLVSMPEVKGMRLLRDFLLTPGLTSGDQAIMDRVVSHLLVPPALESHAYDAGESHEDDYRLRFAAAYTIQQFLGEAARWTHLLSARQLDAVAVTSRFIERVTNGHWAFHLKGRHAALLHGDFHCRNVFVGKGIEPTLIDFGRSEVFPRLFDLAALDVDLLLSVQECGDGRDHDFRRIDLWFRHIVARFPYSTKADRSHPTTKLEWMRQTLLTQLVEQIGDVTAQEYGEVLIFHFLRYLRFPNISPARKVLACYLTAKLISTLGLSPSVPAKRKSR